jgi:hypothetical protein
MDPLPPSPQRVRDNQGRARRWRDENCRSWCCCFWHGNNWDERTGRAQTELVYVTDLTRPDRLLLDKNGPTLSFVRNPHLMLWIESQPKVFIFELDLNTLPKTWFQRSQFLGFEKRCGEVSKNNFHAKLKIYVLGSEFIPGGDALKLIILKLVV